MNLGSTTICALLLIITTPLVYGSSIILIPKRHRIPIPEDIARQLVKDGAEVAKFRAEAVDLSQDGNLEIIVSGGCSAVGNCSVWVFRRTRSGYEPLLIEGEAQIVTLGGVGPRRYRDLVFRVHESAHESAYTTYRFDGQQYHFRSCIRRSYAFLDNKGRMHELRRPRIERC